jgi:hypothetical protein
VSLDFSETVQKTFGITTHVPRMNDSFEI